MVRFHRHEVGGAVDGYRRSMSDSELHPEPVAVASYADRGEAEVTLAHLVDNGIHAEIVDEVEGGTVPVIGEMRVRVLVPAADAEVARQVLDS
jgi:hypothetical protein